MNVLVIGKPTYNVILPLNNFLLEGSKTKITEKLEMSGGSSFYCAYLLAKWGASVHYTGVVGSDIYGAKIKTDLEAAGVNIKYVETNYEKPTSFNYILINNTNGSSTQIIKDDSEVNLVKYKYDFTPDVIIMDGTDMAGSLAALNNFPRAISIVLANHVSEDVYSLTKKATYVVANISFAQALTKLQLEINKPKQLVSFMQKIKDLNKSDYTIMMREHGVLYSSDRQVKMIPAINIEKKTDDTHSGNIFFGAFCYGMVNNYGIDNSVKMANIAAGLSLTKLGSLNAVPSLDEVLKMAGINKLTDTTSLEQAAPTEEPTAEPSVPPATVDTPAISASVSTAFGNEVQKVENQPTINTSETNISNPSVDSIAPNPVISELPSTPTVSETPPVNQSPTPSVENTSVSQGNIFD